MSAKRFRVPVRVRLHFKQRPWDLYLALAYAFASAGVILLFGRGQPGAVFLVLLAPGYLMTAALFPEGGHSPSSAENGFRGNGRRQLQAETAGNRTKEGIDWIERLALSFVLSIAVVPLLGLILNFTPWGIRLDSVILTIAGFTGIMGAVAYIRRMLLSPDDRLSATLDLQWPAWSKYTALEKVLALSLVASLLLAAGTLAYVVATPSAPHRLTQFFILGPNGTAMDYPTALKVSESGTVIIGVTNGEGVTTAFYVRIDLVGINLFYNASTGFNQAVEVNRTTWSTLNVTLADGRNWTQPYSFQINDTGLWKIQFLLFKDSDFSSAYRELHLYVRVT